MSDVVIKDPVKTRASLQRFRVMAIITGVFLLLVFIDVIVKYGGLYIFDWKDDGFWAVSSVIAQIHGFIYVVYLVTSVDLWTRTAWSMRRLAYMVLGGVVPLLSFYAERRITAELTDSLDS